MLRITKLAAVLSAAALAICVSASPACAQLPQKKIIKCGWDGRTPSQIKDDIAAMEVVPADGIIFSLSRCSNLLNRRFDMAAIGSQLDAANKIKWRRFTDNFILTSITADRIFDWFDDAAWADAIRNVGFCARAARLAGCKGLALDPEPYPDSTLVSQEQINLWLYKNQPQAAQKSFEQVQAQVRKRGAQFMSKVQEDLPSPVILAYFLASNQGNIEDIPDAAKRSEALAKAEYGLLPSFLNGMLDAANEKAVICDGNESGYGYDTAQSFLVSYHTIHQRSLALIAPENRRKYVAQVQCAQPVYVDLCFGLGVSNPFSALDAAQQMKFFQFELYNAMKTSDRYVWVYSERMNFWTGRGLPEGLKPAIQSVREKIANGKPLGFEVSGFTEPARREYRKAHPLPPPPAQTQPAGKP